MSLSKVHHSLVSDLFTTLTFLTNQSYILKLNIIKTDKSSKRLPLFCIPQSFPLIILILMTLPTVKCQHTHTPTQFQCHALPSGTHWAGTLNLVVHFQRCPFWLNPLRSSHYAERHFASIICQADRQPCLNFRWLHSSSSASPTVSSCNCQTAAFLGLSDVETHVHQW